MRVNAKDQFNCAWGKPNPNRALRVDGIAAASRALRAIRLYQGSFTKAADLAREGDFVYFAPPYIATKPGGDILYTKSGFGLNDQARLAWICGLLTKRGVHWMVSSSDVRFIRTLYRQYQIDQVSVLRSFSRRVSSRGAENEIIVMNY